MIKYNENSSVIRQKGECQNEGSEKAKHANFSKKTNISERWKL